MGAVDGEPWEMFTSISSLAFDEGGRLHIFDRLKQSLVRFGPDGRFQREFIRRGGGPGEISMPSVTGVERDGTVAVMDMARQALYWFYPEGELMESAVVDPMRGDPMPAAPLHSHPDGGFVSAGTSLAFSGGRAPLGGTSMNSVPIHRFRLGEPTRTLFEAWRPTLSEDDLPTPPSGLGGTGGRGGMMVTHGAGVRAFDPTTSVGVLPDGRIIVSDSTAWTLKVVGLDGRLERKLVRPFQPRGVTAQDRAAERDRRRAQLDGGSGTRVQGGGGAPMMGLDEASLRRRAEARIEELRFAEEIPVVQEIRTDWEGRTWVLRTGPRPGVISATGVYLGTLPPDATGLPLAFGPGGLAAFVEVDELDVPSVVVRRISLDPR